MRFTICVVTHLLLATIARSAPIEPFPAMDVICSPLNSMDIKAVGYRCKHGNSFAKRQDQDVPQNTDNNVNQNNDEMNLSENGGVYPDDFQGGNQNEGYNLGDMARTEQGGQGNQYPAEGSQGENGVQGYRTADEQKGPTSGPTTSTTSEDQKTAYRQQDIQGTGGQTVNNEEMNNLGGTSNGMLDGQGSQQPGNGFQATSPQGSNTAPSAPTNNNDAVPAQPGNTQVSNLPPGAENPNSSPINPAN